MAVSLKGRSYVSLHDFSKEEILQVVQTAHVMKLRQKAGLMEQPLKGKTLGMIFTKPSTRTRVSFEVGIWQLGGMGLFLSSSELQLRRGETIEDTARVLSRYLDGIMIRTFDHQDVVDLARYAAIPVINGLTDLLHPCQATSDLLTIWEKKGRLEGLKLAYVGDGNNMAHSLMLAGAKVGMEVTCVCPPGYEPDSDIVSLARGDAAASGAAIQVTNDLAGLEGADVVYTDVWFSMGDDENKEDKLRALGPYQVDESLMAKSKSDAIFMHCLPAHREEEVAAGVIDGASSVILDQAENRLHAQKAIMALTM